MTPIKTILMIASMHMTACLSYADTYYVAQSDQTPGAFTAWTNAASNIMDVVGVVAGAGDTVLVSNGVYQEYVSLNTDIIVHAVNGPGVTTIDGQGVRRGAYLNHNGAALSGFTICHGVGTSGGGVQMTGGGMLTNCMIISNTATGAAGPSHYGGGGVNIEPVAGSVHQLLNCWIVTNISNGSQGGGGLRRNGSNSDLIMRECHVISNYSGDKYGGGMYLIGGTSQIYNTTIAWNNNTPSFGGAGVYIYIAPRVLFKECIIASNTASGWGGGAYTRNTTSPTIFDGCLFVGNKGAIGGGIATLNSDGISLAISNSVFRDNEASGVGGGIYLPSQNIDTRIINCLFVGNKSTGDNGGGINIFQNGLTLAENLTVVSNTAGGTGGGGGIYGSACSDAVFRNLIVYNNHAPNHAAGGRSNYLFGSGSATVERSCLAPIWGGAGGNNTDAPPNFINVDEGIYQLNAGSPCINTGTNMPWMSDALDLDGRMRIDRFSGLVDMGCYEYMSHGMIFTTY